MAGSLAGRPAKKIDATELSTRGGAGMTGGAGSGSGLGLGDGEGEGDGLGVRTIGKGAGWRGMIAGAGTATSAAGAWNPMGRGPVWSAIVISRRPSAPPGVGLLSAHITEKDRT